MKVLWHLPDDTTSETNVTDIEQLLFLLRLVNGISLKGEPYRLGGSELIVEAEQVSVAITLLNGQALEPSS